MKIVDNIDRCNTAKAELIAHPMCLRLEHGGDKITVIWPYAVQGIHGVRMTVDTGGKTAVYEKLLERCEIAWKTSML